MQSASDTIQITRRILFVTGFVFWFLFGLFAAGEAWNRESVYGTDKPAGHVTILANKGL